MNPLTNVKNIQKMNERMLEMGVEDSQAWHKQYKDSAYVFIGGLPYDLTEGDVLCVFSQYGEIVNVNLVRDKKTGKPKGFCFLCYEDQRSTILAVDNLNGIKLGGRIIRVDHCANYRRPLGDEKDEHGNRKEIIEEGCAPKTPSPSPPASDEEQELLELPKKIKKEKKAKKQKKHKEEKTQKKKKTMVSSGEEDPAEKRKKIEESWSEKAPARVSQIEKDTRDRTNRGIQRDSDSQDLKVTRDNERDRVERDFKDVHVSRDKRDREALNRVRDIRERENEMRGRDVHERDRESRVREYRERDAGGASDRHNREYHTAYNPREQRDRTYHASRHDRDREVDERRRERFDKGRDRRQDEGRIYERRHRNDYVDHKDRR